MAIRIRTMAPSDVSEAAAMTLRGGWGDRKAFFAWAVDQAACHPLVASDAGAIVATGVATAHGRVGWVGTIFVDPERRRAGIGAAMTQAVIDDLESRGCRTLVLIATNMGRPLYERHGFDVLSEQVHLTTVGTNDPGDGPGVRPFRAADLPAIMALDAAATGEDRSAILAGLASPGAAMVVEGANGDLAGFVVKAAWGGAALVAPDPDVAIRLLEWRKGRAGPDGRVGIGLMARNAAGRQRLLAAGWVDRPGGIRMIRGEPLRWQPDWIWGQFNGALG